METVKDSGVGIGERDLRRAVLLERSRRLAVVGRRRMSAGTAQAALDASAAAVRRLAERAA